MARDVPPARRKIRLNQISPLRGSRLRRVPLVVRTLRLRLRSVSPESHLRRPRQGPPSENMHANPALSRTSRRSGDIPSATYAWERPRSHSQSRDFERQTGKRNLLDPRLPSGRRSASELRLSPESIAWQRTALEIGSSGPA